MTISYNGGTKPLTRLNALNIPRYLNSSLDQLYVCKASDCKGGGRTAKPWNWDLRKINQSSFLKSQALIPPNNWFLTVWKKPIGRIRKTILAEITNGRRRPNARKKSSMHWFSKLTGKACGKTSKLNAAFASENVATQRILRTRASMLFTPHRSRLGFWWRSASFKVASKTYLYSTNDEPILRESRGRDRNEKNNCLFE